MDETTVETFPIRMKGKKKKESFRLWYSQDSYRSWTFTLNSKDTSNVMKMILNQVVNQDVLESYSSLAGARGRWPTVRTGT